MVTLDQTSLDPPGLYEASFTEPVATMQSLGKHREKTRGQSKAQGRLVSRKCRRVINKPFDNVALIH